MSFAVFTLLRRRSSGKGESELALRIDFSGVTADVA